MKTRGQVLGALLVLVVVAAGGVYVQREVGPKALAGGPPGRAPSGAWFCPHGGGTDWQVTLEVANPGSGPVQILVTDLSAGKPSAPKPFTVRPGSELLIPEAADARERSSFIEYFGGWVAAGWVAHAGGGQKGAAAEPCLSQAGQRWFLPDGQTTEHQDAYVVVMNPFAAPASVTLTLFTQKRAPITTKAWTNVELKPYRSESFRLNTVALGENVVSTEIDVKVGRVAAASLDISELGGIRSSVGILGTPSGRTILPGGFDQGATTLVVMNAGAGRPTLSGNLLSRDVSQPVGSLQESNPNPTSAQTIPVTTEGPSTLDVRSVPGVALARRTLGVSADQGSTTGVSAPARAWVVLPAVAGPPTHPRLVLANPSDQPAQVTLSILASAPGPVPQPVTVQIPAGRTVAGPKLFVTAKPFSAILAVASAGTFVPATTAYSLGQRGYATYAVSVGVPIPDAWIPS